MAMTFHPAFRPRLFISLRCQCLSMIDEQLEIVNKLGLHARAAAKFVKCAGQFSSEVQVQKNGHLVNGKSIMGIMLLAASKGSQIRLLIEGPDEQDAFHAIERLVAERFGESE